MNMDEPPANERTNLMRLGVFGNLVGMEEMARTPSGDWTITLVVSRKPERRITGVWDAMELKNNAVLSGDERKIVVRRLNALRSGRGMWRRRRSSNKLDKEVKMTALSNVKRTRATRKPITASSDRSRGLMGRSGMRLGLVGPNFC